MAGTAGCSTACTGFGAQYDDAALGGDAQAAEGAQQLKEEVLLKSKQVLDSYEDMDQFNFLFLDSKIGINIIYQYGNLNNVPEKAGMLYVEVKLVGRRNPETRAQMVGDDADLLLHTFTAVAEPEQDIGYDKPFGTARTVTSLL